MLRMGKQTKEEPLNNTPAPPPDQARPAAPSADSYRTTTTDAPTSSAPVIGQPSSTSPAAASTSRAVTESESMARDIKDGNLSGFVGSGTSVTGEATFKMMLRVDGHISGRVTSEDGTLIVSAGGQVDANVEVAVALINGTVNGDIVATKRIEIGRVGKVLGNIKTPALIIENGAVFEGNCQMLQVKAAQTKSQGSEAGLGKKNDVVETSAAVAS